jgi:hypothetical protein
VAGDVALLPTVFAADLRAADFVAGALAAVFFATGAVRATDRLELVFAAGEVERDAVVSAVVCGALLFTAVFLRVGSFEPRAVLGAALLGTVRGTCFVPVTVDLRAEVADSFDSPGADGRRLVVFLVFEVEVALLAEPRPVVVDTFVSPRRTAAACGMTWSLHQR